MVSTGESVRIDFDITGDNPYFGLNVASTGGSFTAGTGSRVSSGEITHNGTQSSGAFSFDWTAPSTPGTYVLSGVGNSVNGNGNPLGDDWNLATDLVMTVCADSDFDGVNTCDGDCDDRDATVYPGAAELCDGLDQDCDAEIDEGLPINDFYSDADGDGYGAGAVTLSDCYETAPVDYSASADDCDDGDDAIYPGAPETWYDGIDSDCADDSDFDSDADGFDSEAELDGGLDCDDTNSDVNPDSEDIPGDGIDQDCDGADASGGGGDGGGSGGGGSADDSGAADGAAEAEAGKTEGSCSTVAAPAALGSWAGIVLFGLLRRRRLS